MINRLTDQEDYELGEALRTKESTFVQDLLKAGRLSKDDFNDKGKTLLMMACYLNNAPLVKDLLAMGADPEIVDANGAKAIHHASFFSTQGLSAKVLIDHGVNIEPRDFFGCTPIMCALSSARINRGVITVLVEAGADLGARNKDNQSVAEMMITTGLSFGERADGMVAAYQAAAALEGATPTPQKRTPRPRV